MTGSASELVYESLPLDDPTQRQPDISLAREKLGWKPQVKLEKGLEPTIDYFRNLLQQRGVIQNQ
jgi:UDP-glucuronate decarboxylase